MKSQIAKSLKMKVPSVCNIEKVHHPESFTERHIQQNEQVCEFYVQILTS